MFNYQASPTLLANKTILISGAGSGIGRTAALTFASHGATVILLGKTVAKLESVYDEIEHAGGPQPAIFPLDLESATDKDYQTLVSAIESEFDCLDGLLNNAGTLGNIVPIEAYSLETWNQVIQINLNASFALSKYLLPLLKRSENASLVLTSSSAGRKPYAYWGAYCVSKYATESLMQILFLELENTSKVRVNTINPGATSTNMRKAAFPAENPDTIASPEDIMPVYLYLMGEDSLKENGKEFNAQ
jgi:NAD(P)-dependent dehydrogenase (short-subunit alcohol dehydrogenase family)